MNKQILSGNLGKDAEVKDFQSGNSVINFSVAHSQTWKDKDGNKQEKTTWVECAWFINNVTIAQYLKKGAKVLVEGYPNARAYQNQNGEIVAIPTCNVQSLEILVFPKDENGQQTAQSPQREQHAGDQFLQGNSQPSQDEGDLPF